ncbi:MAG: amidohydrolase family protein [Actinobacteria bacterium]|nr:amidohydrolase family protein [Actinomycetota bacterium]
MNSPSRTADLVLRHGHVLTVDPSFSSAQAIAVTDGRIVAVGANADMSALIGARTEVVDLDGRTVLPGIHDGHMHLAHWAERLPEFSVDVTDATRLEQIQAAVAERVRSRPAGSWIRGHGWYEGRVADFAGERFPTRHDIDGVSPDHPVVLTHFSSHGVWVNSAALRAAGITATTPDPEGGQIVRDAAGEPTGWLLEAAAALVTDLVPELTRAERAECIVAGMAEMNRRGVTSVTDPMVSAELARCYQDLAREGGLSLRVALLMHWTGHGRPNGGAEIGTALSYAGFSTGLGDEWLRVAGAKLFIDGVPALHTAWMSRPYAHDCLGSLVTDGDTDEARYDEVLDMIARLHAARLQVQVHATGDRACDAAVAGFVAAAEADPWPDARHVVIHGNLISPETAKMMAAHGICANLNSLIKWTVADKLESLYAGDERAGYTMPMRTLLDAGVHVADTSDAPIVDPDWRQAIECMVTRRAQGSGRVSGPEQCVTREEALRAWTIEAAYQEHTEHLKGSIEVGKLADLTVLEEDPLAVPADELHALTVARTYVGGRLVHSR